MQTNHGPLGALYPNRTVGSTTHFMEGGGTIPLAGFYSPGLSDHSEPSWGGWSGRYSIKKMDKASSYAASVRADEEKWKPHPAYTDLVGISDRWIDPESEIDYSGDYAPVWRWRVAMWNDFKARMDWCVMPYEVANHHPRAVIGDDQSNMIVRRSARTGDLIALDASHSSDPDGDDLRYAWWIYPEAGRRPYGKPLAIDGSDRSDISLVIPTDAAGKELHLILEVWDRHEVVPLVDYRRVVINVGE